MVRGQHVPAYISAMRDGGTRARGPVEVLLSERLAAAAAGAVEVERTAPGAPAELRFDARPLLGERPSKEELRKLAAECESVPGVESAFAIPPRVYLRADTQLVVDAVAAGVAATGRRYGWRTVAAVDEPVISSIGCPNANKPLHIGHLRNCFLGMAVSRLFETQGHDVLRTEELANYGVHICQTLVAYQRWGDGGDPVSARRKPDHFVGDFYTRFHREREVSGELDDAAAELLLRMDAGSAEDLALNERVTEWAIDGIRRTYERIGLRHDFVLRELEALPVALELIERGLESGVCRRRLDGSVYADLTDSGLGEVTLLRRDGTALALVCFVAIWVRRAQLHPSHRVIRVTGEQWRESFTQFLEILRRLGHERTSELTEGVYYGMIRTPVGKLGSRSGHDAAADDLLDAYRDRFVESWDGAASVPYRRETCERLAVALLKLFILGKKREDTIVYDRDAAWDETVPRMARLLEARRLAASAGPPPSSPSPLDALPNAARELALVVNGLPRAFERGLARRDSSELVGWCDDVARRTIACERAGGLHSELGAAVDVSLRNALWALDIDLPSSSVELPPSLSPSPAVRR
jgi:arginyl-tRNA synthetase